MLNELIDDVFLLVAIRGEILLRDIQEIFGMRFETAYNIIDFLIKYDFVKVSGRYITLTDNCRLFFHELVR
jgi:hypothetical protein